MSLHDRAHEEVGDEMSRTYHAITIRLFRQNNPVQWSVVLQVVDINLASVAGGITLHSKLRLAILTIVRTDYQLGMIHRGHFSYQGLTFRLEAL